MKKIREQFLKFFESKNHLIVPSAPLFLENDLTLMFVNSGMAPLKKYFLNQEIPKKNNLTSSQICLRVGGKHNDLADIGYSQRHHTSFEMLGNFSFGDYFKEQSIFYAFDFITNVLNLDKKKLYITVYTEDEESYKIWQKYMPAEKIVKLKNNIWKMGDIGPFGYCSEIFYDLEEGTGNLEEGTRFLEIWNLVFMEYYNNGIEITKLEKKCIDTGMGLERIACVLENKLDTYDTNFFKQNLHLLNCKNHNIDTKIFLDHLKTSSILINQNILPGANEANFVLRRIIRRALKSFYNLNLNNFEFIVKNILNNFQNEFDFEFEINNIIKILIQEKNQFEKIINNGLNKFNYFIEKENNLTAQNLYLLHDTYGFNIDLSLDLIKQNNYNADLDGFNKLMEENKEKSKKKINMQLNYNKTNFVDLQECFVEILDIYENYLILKDSPFYAEKGGQIGDVGFLENDNLLIKINNTIENNDVFLHEFEIVKGEITDIETLISNKNKICAKINIDHRNKTSIHHSATHILNHILHLILKEPKQMGSFVSNEKLRLDFECNQEIDKDEIEKKVNDFISLNYSLEIFNITLEEAKKMGAIAYFTYDSIVRVVKFGDSIELCAGTHVQNTSQIKIFKILKMYNIKAGIKRIEAVAGDVCLNYINEINKKIEILKEIKNYFNENEINEIIDNLNNKIKQKFYVKKSNKINLISRKIKEYKIGLIVTNKNSNLENIIEENNFDLLIECVENNQNLQLRLKLNENFSKKFNAKEMLTKIAYLVKAKGVGGRLDFAQTGGVNIENKELILDKLEELLKIC